MRAISISCVVAVLLSFASPADAQTVLVEAEGFDDYGGWSVDQQFIDQMGSSMLLAHGLGVPVADATTTVEFPAASVPRLHVGTPFGSSAQPDVASRVTPEGRTSVTTTFSAAAEPRLAT